MADVTMAPTQEAIAESLLGDPQEQQVAEREPETEQQLTEQQDTQAVEQPQEQQLEEQANDWLPSEQEKVFPDEVLGRYAQRYGLDEQALSNPQIRQLVVDKINSDIWIQQQNAQFDQQQFVEPEQVAEPTPEAAPLSREQYFANLDRAIAERTDPQAAKDFHAGFLRVFGVPEQEIAKISPQQAQQFTAHMSRFGLNLLSTFIPDLLQAQLANQIGTAFPGFSEMYERSSYAMAWDRVRNSNPAFADLPAYGSKQFSQQLREAAAKIPGFDEMQFTDNQGRPLSMMENSARKYGMLAQAIKGQIDPALVQRAAAAQNASQRRAAVRRSAGNLGSGQSKAASGQNRGSSQFQSNTDIFDDATMDLWQREHGRI